jgi:hypothetical protein
MPTQSHDKGPLLQARVARKRERAARAYALQQQYRKEYPPEHHGRIMSDIATETGVSVSTTSRDLDWARRSEAA